MHLTILLILARFCKEAIRHPSKITFQSSLNSQKISKSKKNSFSHRHGNLKSFISNSSKEPIKYLKIIIILCLSWQQIDTQTEYFHLFFPHKMSLSSASRVKNYGGQAKKITTSQEESPQFLRNLCPWGRRTPGPHPKFGPPCRSLMFDLWPQSIIIWPQWQRSLVWSHVSGGPFFWCPEVGAPAL